jgi:uncharacterized protein YegJ (DUF2314 family)
MTRRNWLVVLVFIVSLGCTARPVVDRVISVPSDDPQMNAAIAKARATVDDFVSVLRAPKASQSMFSVKIPISDGDEREHFWLSGVRYDGSEFSGKIDNDPETVKTVKLGQAVSARSAEISDWMYVDHGKLVGGYTLRVLRDRMSPSDRAEFDRSVPFKVE